MSDRSVPRLSLGRWGPKLEGNGKVMGFRYFRGEDRALSAAGMLPPTLATQRVVDAPSALTPAVRQLMRSTMSSTFSRLRFTLPVGFEFSGYLLRREKQVRLCCLPYPSPGRGLGPLCPFVWGQSRLRRGLWSTPVWGHV
jgi:hypothetical protein